MPRSSMLRQLKVGIIVVLSVMNWDVAVSFGQPVSPPVTAGYKSGQVTEVRPPSSIEIDERSYELKTDVVILDREGEPLELVRILPTSLVKFHLKEGRIDRMVVRLPE